MRWRLILRLTLVLLGLFFCYRLIVSSAKAGYSRLFSTISMVQSGIDPARAAVRSTPADPEPHYTLALALVNHEQLPEAVVELREAIRLRPHHYYEWLDLGLTLDRLNDAEGALAALKESIRLAPSFAQPRWQIGSFYYRQGRYEEAFADLRRGAKSNPGLADSLFRLAWVAADEDVSEFLSLVRPDTQRTHLEVARFLATKGKGEASVEQVREAGEVTSEDDRSLAKQTVSVLLSAQEFSAAFEAWKLSHTELAKNLDRNKIVNGDFLNPIPLDDPGFGWQLPSNPAAVVAIDPSGPEPGTRSLRIEYAADNSPSAPVIRQLSLLEPGKRYSLSFLAKADNLISGGHPIVVTQEANGNSPRILGQSEPLAIGTVEWTRYAFEFATDNAASGVFVSLQRQPCPQNPCPIFGKLWLSKFSMTELIKR